VNLKKIITGIIFVLIIVGAFFFLRKDKNTPTVEIGEKVEELGRDHVTDIFGITYNSNPPTSGTHFPVWAKKGFYDRLISDGYLIHSMEHGYIVIWYDCSFQSPTASLVKTVLAHDEPLVTSPDSQVKLKHMNYEVKGSMSWFTPETAPAVEAELPQSFKTESCQQFVEDLKPYLNEADRIVIVPRVDMDAKIILTAWGRILKLNDIDEAKMKEFIKTYHNKGPEKTVE
jgi:hypothetical protein